MDKSNILLTGATGLLGSWLTEKLLEKDCKVTGVALNNELDFLLQSKNIIDRIDLRYIDISDEL